MKAKEYAKKVKDTNNIEEAKKALAECGRGFLNEFIAMKDARRISTDMGLLPLIKEFDAKFRLFAVLVDEKYKGFVNRDGFLEILNLVSPETVTYYNKNKK